uniref:Putative secreted protein n=1 Tax=Rhipicephalus microplus TaxID=6941 RepID=A0A6M2DBY9_RHIMP
MFSVTCTLLAPVLVQLSTDGMQTEGTAELVAFPSFLLYFLTPCCTIPYKHCAMLRRLPLFTVTILLTRLNMLDKDMLRFTLSPPPPLTPHPHFSFPPATRSYGSYKCLN